MRPKTLEPKYKNKFIGSGGWPAYRPSGLGKVDNYGLDSVRSGGTDRVRSGGTDIVRSGGTDVVRTIARLCSMKNFPAGFHQPQYVNHLSNIKNLKEACIHANAQNLLDGIRNGSQQVLQKAVQGLTAAEKKKIKSML